ncbi:PD-(D/E)XK nuclease family protein [Patulibacter defluvii]|uniref:PD-(D/E)XK nuclease family protein n=1 Tax=Patulibacter defluvii TaxID=3095358 RepID=UPI002A75DA36|nr:PD-(D/E)XK nuclease family protein [Patulibacter sp. DM4]
MTLQLVTGPTNARKAGVVLGLVRRWALEARAPVLVVPTGPDADRYRRELLDLGGGAAVGVTVVTPKRLADLVRRAVGVPRPTLGPVARDRMLAAALAPLAPARPLGGTARRPAVRRRLDGLLEELAARGVDPALLHDELERLDPAEHGVDRMLVADLREVLDAVAAAGARAARDLDAEADRGRGADGTAGEGPLRSPGAVALAVRRALAAAPERWQGRPVALYGFDDLTDDQLALVRTLARAADVVVSLPFEDGRIATAGRRAIVDELRVVAAQLPPDGLGTTGLLPLRAGSPLLEGSRVAEIAPRELVLAAAGDDDGGRARLQRRLFEPPDPDPDPDPEAAPGDAPAIVDDVVLITGGDARSETEALVAELRRVVDEHALQWHQVAIAVRDAEGPAGARIERELRAQGVPVARPREQAARRTALGRAAVALGRVVTDAADAEDVLMVLHAAADPERSDAVDRLAIGLRRDAIGGIEAAIERAARVDPRPVGLGMIEAARRRAADATLAGAPGGGALHPTLALTAALVPAIEDLERLMGSRILPAERDDERRAAARIHDHLEQIAGLVRFGDGLLPDPAELLDELAELPVPTGERPGPGRLEIAAPGALRGRHVAVLALADLREAAFPAPEPIDPLIDREAREVLRAAGNVTLDLPADRLAAERMLFLELVARPTTRLLLSRPAAAATGEPLPAAPFLADVEAALAPARPRTVHRPASAIVRPARRAVAAAAPLGLALDDVGRETVRRVLLDRSRFAVREVERLARCPVCWLVEHLAAARDDAPETEPQRHGLLVHAVLQQALDAVAGEGAAYGELDPEALVAAGRAALDEAGPRAVVGLPEHRARVLLRRAEAGIAAVLRALPDRYAAARLHAAELRIDDDGDLPPIDLGDGATAVGRIDRVDRVPLPDGDEGLGVVDYKLGSGGAVSAGRWEETATLQAALYLYAVATGVGGPPAYALYQPTAPRTGIDPAARPPAGLELRGVLDGVRRRGPADLDALEEILAVAVAQARAAVSGLRGGVIAPLPGTSVHGEEQRCDHPAIARLLP